MEALVLSHEMVSELLPMKDCIDVVREALKTLSLGNAVLPLRQILRLPDGRGLLAMMPAYLGNPQILGVKVISVFPANRDSQYEAHQGAVLLFETQNGKLLGVVDASSITAIRTAAASGVATDVLANKDASSLGILGSGTQANSHYRAMLEVRKVNSVKVWSRDRAHSVRFALAHSKVDGVEIRAVDTAEEAVRGSDLVCTTTGSAEPVLRGGWLSPGTHINAVGASVKTSRELDTEAVKRSRFFVDRRESALNESGDFRIPREEGAITDDHILGEVGDVLLGKVPGRRSDEEITVFKSLGIAVEDLAAAHFVYARAMENGLGLKAELNPQRNLDEPSLERES